MKTDKSSNSHEDSRKVFHPEDREAMKGTSKLQSQKPDDGRKETDEKASVEKKEVWDTSKKQGITGKSNEEDVKKEFEIRSGKKSDDDIGRKREKEPKRGFETHSEED